MRLRRSICCAVTFCCLFLFFRPFTATAQEVGLSFSYFIPKNGYFSTPISPFSIRGVGVELGDFFALQTGATLYRMSGLNMSDLPFESKEPFIGPNFTAMVPVELVLVLSGKNSDVNFKVGAFGFISFDNKLNEGNIDRALREWESWQVVNSDLSLNNSPGFGYHFGMEYIYYFRKFGLSLEANYFIGGAKTGLQGTYIGGNTMGPLETKTVDFSEAKIDYTGLEIAMGILFGG